LKPALLSSGQPIAPAASSGDVTHLSASAWRRAEPKTLAHNLGR
jgi:hypothetical protein